VVNKERIDNTIRFRTIIIKTNLNPNNGFQSVTNQGINQRLIMTSNENVSVMPLLKLMRILGYAGLIPFIIPVCLILNNTWLGLDIYAATSWIAYAPYLFISYGSVILSFMCGTLWAGWQTIGNNNLAKFAVLMSNLLALSAWSALLLVYITPVAEVFCVILILFGFMSLLWVERLIGGVEKAYWHLRLSLTGIVMALHLVMITLLFMEF
jgi:hypothetical protein